MFSRTPGTTRDELIQAANPVTQSHLDARVDAAFDRLWLQLHRGERVQPRRVSGWDRVRHSRLWFAVVASAAAVVAGFTVVNLLPSSSTSGGVGVDDASAKIVGSFPVLRHAGMVNSNRPVPAFVRYPTQRMRSVGVGALPSSTVSFGSTGVVSIASAKGYLCVRTATALIAVPGATSVLSGCTRASVAEQQGEVIEDHRADGSTLIFGAAPTGDTVTATMPGNKVVSLPVVDNAFLAIVSSPVATVDVHDGSTIVQGSTTTTSSANATESTGS